MNQPLQHITVLLDEAVDALLGGTPSRQPASGSMRRSVEAVIPGSFCKGWGRTGA